MTRKLIFIAGICGSGKSTTAQQISFHLQRNGVKVRWLHEHCRNNPLRRTKTNLKKSGCADVGEYMALATEIWTVFMSEIMKDDLVYVIDGYAFQSTVLNLFEDGFPNEIIERCFAAFCSTIGSADPLIVNLYKPDLRPSFSNVWKERGDHWKRISINIPLDLPEKDVDYDTYERDGLLQWKAFQRLNDRLLRNCSLGYLQIDTSGAEWASYYDTILQALGHKYENTKTPEVETPAKYTGVYANQETSSKIVIKEVEGKLYCEIFWPFMRLVPVSGVEFYIRGLPIRLRFAQDRHGQVTSFRFIDDYDWDLTDKICAKVPDV